MAAESLASSALVRSSATSSVLLFRSAVVLLALVACTHAVVAVASQPNGNAALNHQLQQQNYHHYNHVADASATQADDDDEASLRCTRRLSTYRIAQTDAAGRECWDNVSVWTCEGRCDSTEISDWKFPYKRSFHPVCVHAGRAKAVAWLRQCEEGADAETRRYEYMEAVACKCQTCSSWDTRCEAPHTVPDGRSVRVLTLSGQSLGDADDASDDY